MSQVVELENNGVEISRQPSPPSRQLNYLDRLIVWIAAKFGDKSKEIERFLRFAVVGVIGAIVDFGVLNILQLTILHPYGPNESLNVKLATGLAFSTAVTSNFIWNRYWTYPDSRSRHIGLQLVQFFFINAVGLGFRLIFVSSTYAMFGEFAHEILGDARLHGKAINQLGTNVAQGFSMVVVMFWNFFANRYWTYGDVN